MRKISTKSKAYSIIIAILILLTMIVSVLVIYSFQEYGIKKTKQSASVLAQSVRDGLTTHMIHGIMDQRDIYLQTIQKNQKIKNIKVLRSNSVIEQYGKGQNNETTYDEIEIEVLTTSVEKSKVIEKNNQHFLRVTIPYVATAISTPNCMACHNGNVGEVLGAISMEVNMDDVIIDSREVVFKIIAISLLLVVISLVLVSRYIKPYIKLFNDLEDGIQKAHHGNFDYYIDTKLDNEAGKVAKKLNDLSNIFLFKKTIENDPTKEYVYQRLLHILKEKFHLNKVALFETSLFDKYETLVYGCEFDEKKKDQFIASKECRALRTNDIVYSSDFYNICNNCNQESDKYICLPFTIGKEKTLIVNIEFGSQDEMQKFKKEIAVLTNYIQTAKPVLESKILHEKLEEKALKDPLTKLYNRRYLEKFINDNINNTQFEYSILMIDVDYFKMTNDEYGHDIGDKVLFLLGEILIQNIKGSDLACRYGGEEFIVLLVGATKQIAEKIAENIRLDFEKQNFSSNNESFHKTLSVGVATFKEDANNHWHTIKCADEALYYAKNHGRNKVVKFTQDMHTGKKELY